VIVEDRLRASMLSVAAPMAVGTLGELVLTEHTGDPIQWVPFVLLGAELGAIALFLVAPRAVAALRATSVLLVLGSAFGIWEHLEHNYAFEAEIRPGAPTSVLAWEALYGASPLLAPGAIGAIGLLAGLSTLGRSTSTNHRRPVAP
jgi:hypothetical protein